MLKEFKQFAMRGNVVDMAVGVIVGGAFGKIVTSLVNDLLMPPLGLVVGNMDFSEMVLTLKPAVGDTKAVTINYGIFINNVLNFLIVTFCIFLTVKALSHLHKQEPPPLPTQRDCPYCLTPISKRATRCPNCTSSVLPA